MGRQPPPSKRLPSKRADRDVRSVRADETELEAKLAEMRSSWPTATRAQKLRAQLNPVPTSSRSRSSLMNTSATPATKSRRRWRKQPLSSASRCSTGMRRTSAPSSVATHLATSACARAERFEEGEQDHRHRPAGAAGVGEAVFKPVLTQINALRDRAISTHLREEVFTPVKFALLTAELHRVLHTVLHTWCV